MPNGVRRRGSASGAAVRTVCGRSRTLLLDQCYGCPEGYHRSLAPGIDLTGNEQACRRD